MTLGEEVWLTTLIWLGLVAGGGLVCGCIWLLCWRGRGPLLPRPRPGRPVHWGGLELFCLFLLNLFLWPELFLYVIKQRLGPLDDGSTVLQLFLAHAFALPLQVATVFFILWQVRRVRPFEVGVHTARLPANVTVGYLGWLVLCPLVYAVDFLTIWCYVWWTGGAPEPNDLTKLIQDPNSVLAWALFWFLAVGAAPVLEELMFRGLLQGWLMSRPWARWYVAVAVQSVLWSALHPWPTPIPLFLLGLGLGWLAYRTRSLVGPMVLHALFNAVGCTTFAVDQYLNS